MPNAILDAGAEHALSASAPCAVRPTMSSTVAAVGGSFGLVLAVGVGLASEWNRTVVVAALALVPACAAAACDIATRRLPSAWVVATAFVAVLAGLAVGGPSQLAIASAAAGVAALPLLAAHLAAPSSLGFGDVRCAAALGLVVGAVADSPATAAVAALVTVAVASGTAIVVAAILRRRHVVFGPYLVLGAAAALSCTFTWGAALSS